MPGGECIRAPESKSNFSARTHPKMTRNAFFLIEQLGHSARNDVCLFFQSH